MRTDNIEKVLFKVYERGVRMEDVDLTSVAKEIAELDSFKAEKLGDGTIYFQGKRYVCENRPRVLSCPDHDKYKEYLSQLDEWVSVEDRLPDEKDNVLIYIQHDEIPIIGYKVEKGWRVFVSDDIQVMGDAYLDNDIDEQWCKVTHWQPLPQPPKQK